MNPCRQLLIIDPQNDFCDIPTQLLKAQGVKHQAALAVTGAHQDMLRLAQLIEQKGDFFDAITTTLDSHHELDIAHPGFWKKKDGTAVEPFTVISRADFENGVYCPTQAEYSQKVAHYLQQLEQQNRYQLMVWPTHCVMGTWGHQVHFSVKQALERWEQKKQKTVQWVTKGKNILTEHYSAMQAEVPDAQDPETQLNLKLIHALDQCDEIYVAGEASSHCVKATIEHLVQHLPSQQFTKIILLTDCMSAVTGFEQAQSDFFSCIQNKGLRLRTTTELYKARLQSAVAA